MNSLRLLGLLLLLAFAVPVQALRCDSRVVDRGDRDFEVRERCGEPFWTEQFYVLDVYGADGPFERQLETVYDAWYFNFGPRRLMTRLLFRDGVLEREETLGYGVSAIGEGCNPDALAPGTPSGEIVARCGEPLLGAAGTSASCAATAAATKPGGKCGAKSGLTRAAAGI